MPVLPIIDLLIFVGWTTLAAGGVLKAIYIATSYRPQPAGLDPSDLLTLALCFLLMALTLSARSLVRHAEARGLGNRSPRSTDEFGLQGTGQGGADGPRDDATAQDRRAS